MRSIHYLFSINHDVLCNILQIYLFFNYLHVYVKKTHK